MIRRVIGSSSVIPAQAGIQHDKHRVAIPYSYMEAPLAHMLCWIPACAGMTQAANHPKEKK